MKTIKNIFPYTCLLSLLFVFSCRDEALDPNLAPQAAAHGYGELASGAFDATNIATSSVDVAVQWISIDNKVEISEIELYVNFYESYIDKDGNPAVIVHGGATGITAPNLVLTGLANRKPGTANITAEQVYEFYKDVEFDYNGDGVKEKVFDEAKRPASARFLPERLSDPNNPNSSTIPADSFEVTWRLKAKDGKVYKSWSPSVCTEFPGANCDVTWEVE